MSRSLINVLVVCTIVICVIIFVHLEYTVSRSIITYDHNDCISKILNNKTLSETSAHVRLSICRNDVIDIRYFLKNHSTIIGINLNKMLYDRIVQESEWVNDTIARL
jgi:hypothetical protein